MRWIAYVDMDAFYVACEQRADPSLAGKPVVVGPDPRRGPSRGVVLSASYEARATGVRSAIPVAAALRLCPDAIFVRPDFEKYVAASHEVRVRLRTWGGRVEPRSIDEAVLEMEADDRASALRQATAVRDDLRATTGLSASIGVAPNRPVAKIASDRAKPGGVIVVPADEVATFLAPLPVGAVPGIGPKTAERLGAAGLRTIGELANASGAKLHATLGGYGVELRSIARGTYEDRPTTHEGPRSRSVDRTFREDVGDVAPLVARVEELADELGRSLDEEKLGFRTVTVALKWADFDRAQRSRSLPWAATGGESLRRAAAPLARELFHREAGFRHRPVRMVSVRAERLFARHGAARALEAFAGVDGVK